MKIIKCSRFKFAQYISHKDLLSNLVASLYSNSFNSKSEYSSFFLMFKLFGLNLDSLIKLNLSELLKLKLKTIFFLSLETKSLLIESLELFLFLGLFVLPLIFFFLFLGIF